MKTLSEKIIEQLQSKHDAFLGTKGELSRQRFKDGLMWAIDTIETLTEVDNCEKKHTDLPNYDIIHDNIGRLSNDLNKKLEDYFIEGLKIKGFEFKHKIELESFIKERCRCEDNINLKEKVYYVDSIPFFLHNYEIEPFQMPSITDKEYKISANLGTYAYL